MSRDSFEELHNKFHTLMSEYASVYERVKREKTKC